MAKIKQIDGLQAALDTKLVKNDPITAATKTKISYSENGLVTAGADLAEADIPTISITSKTSGTLTVARGGTGKTTATLNSYLKGNGTSGFIERTYAEVKTDLGLDAASNYAAVKKAASSTAGKLPKWVGAAGDEIVDGYGVVTTIRDSVNATDVDVPSEKSVRTAITNAMATADAMSYKGSIDCSTNPNYPAANAGDTYKVSVAGKIGGASGVNVMQGFLLVCLADNTASGTHAVVGANWDIVPVNNAGEVIGPAGAVDANIAVFSGTTGKLIADGGTTIAAIQAGASRQAKQKFTGHTANANTELILGDVLSQPPSSGTEPQLYVNGLNYERGTYASLATDQWGFSVTTLKLKMGFAIEAADEIIIVYNY